MLVRSGGLQDQRTELACGAMAEWSARQVGLHFIPPVEPCETATSPVAD